MRKTKAIGVIAILLAAFLTACLKHSDYDVRHTGKGITPAGYALRSDPLVVFFFRESSYKGLGRIHELKIDDKSIGPLTADSYFRLELWSGDYQFSVHLPSEDFFGSYSPPENTILRLSFVKSAGSGIFVYKYVDGEGIYRVEPVDDAVIARIEHTRVLSANLSARDTAQVKFLHGARYDGPASSGKAHGYGTLTWDDGSILRGRFEYGETTQEGEFFTTGGQIYMGPESKGRPIGPGVWMTLDRRILYAGPFKDELPHGTGIRSGIEAPEFCVYENGKDITKTVRQLAQETVEEEDRRMKKEKTMDVESKYVSRIEPKPARDERISAKCKTLKQRIEKELEDKRLWCEEEFALGRQLCKCAPFAIEFERWSGCVDR